MQQGERKNAATYGLYVRISVENCRGLSQVSIQTVPLTWNVVRPSRGRRTRDTGYWRTANGLFLLTGLYLTKVANIISLYCNK